MKLLKAMENYLKYMGYMTLFYAVSYIIVQALWKLIELDQLIFLSGIWFADFARGKEWEFKH